MLPGAGSASKASGDLKRAASTVSFYIEHVNLIISLVCTYMVDVEGCTFGFIIYSITDTYHVSGILIQPIVELQSFGVNSHMVYNST